MKCEDRFAHANRFAQKRGWIRRARVARTFMPVDIVTFCSIFSVILITVCNYVIHEKCFKLVATPCTSYLTDHIKVGRDMCVHIQ